MTAYSRATRSGEGPQVRRRAAGSRCRHSHDGAVDRCCAVSTSIIVGRSASPNSASAVGPHAAELLRRAVLLPEAPDLYVNSDVHPATLDVSAFEPLVGCHGGLGGWQTSAVLLWPSAARELGSGPGEEPIVGADAMHRQLVELLERLGHRGELTGTGSRSEDPAAATNHTTA